MWFLCRISMAFLWGFYVGFLWDFYGISMGFLWDFHGISMGFVCRISMGLYDESPNGWIYKKNWLVRIYRISPRLTVDFSIKIHLRILASQMMRPSNMGSSVNRNGGFTK